MIPIIVFVWLFYIGAAALTVLALRQINLRALVFMDGMVVGSVYYLIIPMFFVLLSGELYPNFLHTDSYLPYQDLDTTSVIIGGMYVVALIKLFTRRRVIAGDTTSPAILKAMLVLFGASTLYTFISSGILQGGHWYHAMSDALETDTSFLLAKHVANFARTSVFAVLFYAYTRRWITRRSGVLIGLAVVLVDMAMTFNRVTAVYYLIMLALLFHDRRKMVAAVALVGLPTLAIVGSMFPMFRGILTTSGFTLSGILEAATVTLQYHDSTTPFVTSMDGVFESSNLVVLNYVVKHAGGDLPLLHGYMFIRPATFFLPKMIWANRPPNVGNLLGDLINNDNDLALNSTMFGESVANFGHFWFVGFAILLLIYEYLFRLIGGRSRVCGFIAAFTAFAMCRFDTVFGMISMMMMFMLVTGLSMVAGLRGTRPARPAGRPVATAAAARPRRLR